MIIPVGTNSMRIVSNQSEQDMRRRETRDGLVWPLRELSEPPAIANGRGKPIELPKQLQDQGLKSAKWLSG
jgi:hypothetical protein